MRKNKGRQLNSKTDIKEEAGRGNGNFKRAHACLLLCFIVYLSLHTSIMYLSHIINEVGVVYWLVSTSELSYKLGTNCLSFFINLREAQMTATGKGH